jgi:hypothetical protein
MDRVVLAKRRAFDHIRTRQCGRDSERQVIDASPEAWLQEFKRGFRERVRFAIRSPEERYSAAWVTRDTKSDFYIATRSVMGAFKISLHKSGRCRLAFEKPYFDFAVDRGLIPAEEDRVWVKWWRSPTPSVGAALVVGLVFPTDFLHLDAPTATAEKPFVFLQAAPRGKAVEIGFFYSHEPVNIVEPKLLEFGIPLFWTELDNGDTVWMVGREADFDATALPSADALNSISGRLLNPDVFTTAVAEGRTLTANLWNAPKDNEALIIIEVGGVATSVDVIPCISSLFNAARTET